MAKDELPPPAHVLLAYAADGWAVQNGQLSPAGKPRHPKAEIWQPVARALLQEPDGLERLRELALAGMAAWGVDPSIMACVSPAFDKADFINQLAQQLGMQAFRRPLPAAPVEPLEAERCSTPAPPAPGLAQSKSVNPKP